MHGGGIAQQGSPTDLYELPATKDVARFIGDANFVAGIASGAGAATAVGPVPLAEEAEGPVEVMIRPERLLATPGEGGVVEGIEYYGHDAVYVVRLAEGTVLRSRIIGAPVHGPGDGVSLEFVGAPTVAYAAVDAAAALPARG